MDDVIVRSRYPRHSTSGRKKRRNPRDANTLLETVMRQVIISVLVLTAIGIIKSINTPATNFLSDRIKGILSQNIELKNVYEGIDGIVGKYVGSKVFDNGKNIFDKEAVPANANISDTDSVMDAVNTGSAADSANDSVNPKSDADSNAMSTINRKYKFVPPVDGVLGSGFGERIHPINGTVEFHKGIDIEASNGASIRAALGGEVTEAGTERTYGKYVKIKHGDGIVTVYAHCSQLIVNKGQKVDQGSIIARVGDTGASIGSHLHFEIWKDGKPLNPESFIKIPLK